MQLYAKTLQQKIIAASQASKGQDYFCLECGSLVRKRGGIHRNDHFFHLHPPDSCRQNGKSMPHIQTQIFLESLLPPGESFLEYPFPTIKRIADVAWISNQLVFEIQCSPIKWEEIAARNKDYALMGYQVIWILHDSRFNQWKLSGAEIYLQASPHYFTNMDAEGCGMIYDQFQILRKGLRMEKLPPLVVDLSQPMQTHFKNTAKNLSPSRWTEWFTNRELRAVDRIPRRHKWPLFFQGDLTDHAINIPNSYFEAVQLIEKEWTAPKPTIIQRIKHYFYKGLFRPYNLLFQMLLEKACR